MPDLRDLGFMKQERTEGAYPQLEHGIIARTADDFADEVEVILPEFDNAMTWGPCKWQARNATDLPQAGDECLVAFSNRREPWILAWWPDIGAGSSVGRVQSVFGRSGVVVAQAGDYAVAQVTGAQSAAQVASAITANGPKVTSGAIASGPPGSPNDGDIWIATNVDGQGTAWQFRYNAGSGSAYKWEFIGGPPTWTHYDYPGGQTIGVSTWTAVTNLAITLARGGDYIFEAAVQINAGVTGSWQYMPGLSRNSTTTLISGPEGSGYFGYPIFTMTTTNGAAMVTGKYRYTGAVAADVFRCMAWCSSSTQGNVGHGRFTCLPIRIS